MRPEGRRAGLVLALIFLSVGCGGAHYAHAKTMGHVLEGERGGDLDAEPAHATDVDHVVRTPVDEGLALPSPPADDVDDTCRRGSAVCIDDTVSVCTSGADGCMECTCVPQTSSVPPSPWINPNRPAWPQ